MVAFQYADGSISQDLMKQSIDGVVVSWGQRLWMITYRHGQEESRSVCAIMGASAAGCSCQPEGSSYLARQNPFTWHEGRFTQSIISHIPSLRGRLSGRKCLQSQMIFRWSSDSPLISFVELQTCHEAQESH